MDSILQILLGPFSSLVLLLLIVYGGWKRWWVFGWHYSEVVKEKEEWKGMALLGTKIAEKVASALPDNGNKT